MLTQLMYLICNCMIVVVLVFYFTLFRDHNLFPILILWYLHFIYKPTYYKSHLSNLARWFELYKCVELNKFLLKSLFIYVKIIKRVKYHASINMDGPIAVCSKLIPICSHYLATLLTEGKSSSPTHNWEKYSLKIS